MPVLSLDSFPSLKTDEVGCTFEIEGKALAALFAACGFAMADDQSRLYLNGTFLFAGRVGDGEGRKLCGVATDGKRLSAREVAADLPSDMPEVIVPRKAVTALGKLVEGWNTVAVEISASRFIATFGPTRFTTKLVEGNFPDWRRITPSLAPILSYDSDALASAVATAFSAVQHDKKVMGVKLAFGSEETEFTARSADGTSEGADTCPHSLLREPSIPHLGVHPKWLLDIITALAADTIELSFSDALGAVLVTAAALEDRKAIIMPMRI